MEYQSSTELQPETHDAIHGLPRADEVQLPRGRVRARGDALVRPLRDTHVAHCGVWHCAGGDTRQTKLGPTPQYGADGPSRQVQRCGGCPGLGGLPALPSLIP